MSELANLGGGYVRLTASTDLEWRRSVRDFVKQSKGRLKWLRSKDADVGIAYLGTNQPVELPTTPWVRLVLSPAFEGDRLFLRSSVSYYDDQVVMQYEKKPGYFNNVILHKKSPFYVYNPPTVDKTLNLKDQLYFIESNFALKLESCECVRLYHAPDFIDYTGEWEEIDGRQWLVQGGHVVDCRLGSETYHSRRTLLAPPEGKTWLPFSQYGSHWVTYSSQHPQKIYGIDKYDYHGQTFVCLDHSVPIHSVEQRYATEDMGYILSEGEILVVQNPTQEQKDNIPFVYAASNGKCFHEGMRSSGLLFHPSGSRIMSPYLSSHEITPVATYTDDTGTYIDCSNAPPGVSFCIPVASDIDRVSCLMMPYARVGSYQAMLYQAKNHSAINNELSITEGENKIKNYLRHFSVTDLSMTAPTVSTISRMLKLNMLYVHRVLTMSHEYVYWRTDTDPVPRSDPTLAVGACQFVLVSQLLIQQTGDLKPGFIDGMMWNDILGLIGRKATLLSSSGKVRRLIQFLERNLYKVYCIREEGKKMVRLEVSATFLN
jgi:hypothetical protein